VPTHYASCPCCGQTVRLQALNIDQGGRRVFEPVVYGTFLKTRAQNPVTGLMQWTMQPLPPYLLLGLKAQLEAALAYVNAQLTDGDDPLMDS
jgi:hypothetical protein